MVLLKNTVSLLIANVTYSRMRCLRANSASSKIDILFDC